MIRIKINFCIALGILLLLSSELAGQGTMFGVTAYPNISGRRLAATTSVNNAAIDSLEARETSRPSLSLGLAVQWQGLKGGFRTGIQFADTGYRTIREPVTPGPDVPDNAQTQSTVFRNLNIELPAEILFMHELSPRDRLNFMMGFSAAFNVSNYEQTVYFSGERISQDNMKISNDGFQRVQLAFQTGVGWQHEFGENIVFFAQPTFQFWITGLLLEPKEGVNRSLYAFGLKTGILFRTNTNR
jgi:hypothetical protein